MTLRLLLALAITACAAPGPDFEGTGGTPGPAGHGGSPIPPARTSDECDRALPCEVDDVHGEAYCEDRHQHRRPISGGWQWSDGLFLLRCHWPTGGLGLVGTVDADGVIECVWWCRRPFCPVVPAQRCTGEPVAEDR